MRHALAALLLAALSPFAPAAERLHLEDLTSAELGEAIAKGATTILVPIGGTEQNGPHMALGKHNARARALAERIAAKLGNAIVAPVVAYVPEGAIEPPTQHMRYAGTISIPEDAFEKTLEAAARSFRAHGFRDVVLLGDHGGYAKSLERVAERMKKAWARDHARVHAIAEYYRAAETGFARELAQRGFTQSEIGTHAGLADTALTLDTAPTMVRSQRLEQAGKAPGVHGDPTRASRELGAAGSALVVDATVEAIRKAVARR